jgi:uncharacterized protein
MIFLDSSFLISVEVETDQNHSKAIKIRDEIINKEFGETIISDYIFDEIITVTFNKTKDLKKAIIVGNNLKKSANMIKIDEDAFDEAWEIFKYQEKTSLSFTDCTILALMQSMNIKHIATFDEDFKKIDDINVVE